VILAELHLENYKQYAGEHRIEFPPQGIVAVIGANGVGKTTLFEAIEWCLYNPREIENAEVPPRGGVGRTLVRVVLEDPRDGVRYVVERGLKRGVTTAEVYKEDQPEAPLVQGTRPVTDYVSRRLIGLGHRAFVSTFFTRQKELSFFGNLRDTDRRREVGRLLGLETIREAQRLLGDERQLAKTEAAGLALQHQEQSAGRDFPAEIAAAEAVIAEQEAAAAAAVAAHQGAVAAHEAARVDLDRWRELERADAALHQHLTRLDGETRAATARHEAEAAALRRLDQAAATRATLLPLRATEPARRAAVAAFVAERERWQRRRATEADLARAEAATEEAAREMERTVASVGRGGGIPGWCWRRGDGDDPVAAAERLLAATDRLDAEAAIAQAERLADCRRRLDDRHAAAAKLDRYRGALAEITRERDALLAEGDPQAGAAAAQGAREAAVEAAGSARARAEAALAHRRKLETIATSLRAAAEADVCPTCQRPFRPEEVEFTLAALEDAIEEERRREASLARQQTAAERQAAEADRALTAAHERVQRLVKIDGRLAQGTPMVEEASVFLDTLVTECAATLDGLGLRDEPTPAAVAAARAYADLLRAVDRARALLRRLAADAARAAAEAAAASVALAEIGPVAYDAEAHAAAEGSLEEAVTAAARIAGIDEQLARRPDHEAALAAAAAEIERLAGERGRVEAERRTLGFDPTALAAAIAAEKATLADSRAAAAAANEAQEATRDAIRRRDDLRREETRLADLAARATARAREADELDRMYREFARFDQYVAAKVTPQLAEQTSELLAAVTDGKYDRVEFDDNYGLRIYDNDECFPIEEFSGGERDVAALCARLALSRLVGAQAAHPPRFLVLDEVFGSLDQDRRAQVLQTLGALTASTDAFRQLFIVSHVDDVRLSAVVDEVWRVAEIDGVSHWENATRSGGIEDL